MYLSTELCRLGDAAVARSQTATAEEMERSGVGARMWNMARKRMDNTSVSSGELQRKTLSDPGHGEREESLKHLGAK